MVTFSPGGELIKTLAPEKLTFLLQHFRNDDELCLKSNSETYAYTLEGRLGLFGAIYIPAT
jgi:hypothetical protein